MRKNGGVRRGILRQILGCVVNWSQFKRGFGGSVDRLGRKKRRRGKIVRRPRGGFGGEGFIAWSRNGNEETLTKKKERVSQDP